jgi:type I restriction enzyme S subunit
VEFGDVAMIRNVKVMGRGVATGTPCVELDSLSQGSGRLLGTTDAAPESSKYRFMQGDVLFGRLRAYLRKYWLAAFDGLCSTEIWPLIPINERLVPAFLHLLVQASGFVDAVAVAYGTHMPRSDWGVLRKLQVVLPPAPEQAAIAAVLSDMDAELAALEARRDKTRDLKQAMMQELLTGRTRLV